MRYSLTLQKPKELLATDTKLWWIFTFALLFLFFAIKVAITLHTAGIEKRVALYAERQAAYELRREEIEAQIAFVQQQVNLVAQSSGRNQVIRDSLVNLFDLVPDQIYLDTMTITEKSLRIQGHTPSREVFNFMLRPPLESIFQRTEVSFYPAGGGWFSFDVLSTSDEALIYAAP